MRLRFRNLSPWAVLLASWVALGTSGDAQELKRQYCDPEDPDLGCPGPDCPCAPDSLEITFGGTDQSVLEYEEFDDELPFEVTLIFDTRSGGIHSWTCAVAHDPAVVSAIAATTTGTIVPALLDTGFEFLAVDRVETCLTEECSWSDPTQRQPGGGWVCAVVLSFLRDVQLPRARNAVTRAEYRLLQDVGEVGTVIGVSDGLAVRDAPRVEPALEIEGSVYYWTEVTDGRIRRSSTAAVPFVRGDVAVRRDGQPLPSDGIFTTGDALRILLPLFQDSGFELSCKKAADVNDDSVVDISDAIYLLSYLFLGGDHGPPPAPFPNPGLDPTPDALGCTEYP
jgi:hypothetical protein